MKENGSPKRYRRGNMKENGSPKKFRRLFCYREAPPNDHRPDLDEKAKNCNHIEKNCCKIKPRIVLGDIIYKRNSSKKDITMEQIFYCTDHAVLFSQYER